MSQIETAGVIKMGSEKNADVLSKDVCRYTVLHEHDISEIDSTDWTYRLMNKKSTRLRLEIKRRRA